MGERFNSFMHIAKWSCKRGKKNMTKIHFMNTKYRKLTKKNTIKTFYCDYLLVFVFSFFFIYLVVCVCVLFHTFSLNHPNLIRRTYLFIRRIAFVMNGNDDVFGASRPALFTIVHRLNIEVVSQFFILMIFYIIFATVSVWIVLHFSFFFSHQNKKK